MGGQSVPSAKIYEAGRVQLWIFMNFKSPLTYFLTVLFNNVDPSLDIVDQIFNIVDRCWDELDPTSNIYELQISTKIFLNEALLCNDMDQLQKSLTANHQSTSFLVL